MSLMLLVSACTGDGDSVKGGTQDLVVTDDMNYSYSGTLEFPVYEARAYSVVTVDWSRLTKDILCHDLTPPDVKHAGLSLFQHLDNETLAAGLVSDTVLQSDLTGYVDQAITDASTSVALETMTFQGAEVDVAALFAPTPDGSWLFNLAAGDDFDSDILIPAFLEPTEDSAITTVYLEDDCEIVNFEFDLHSLTKLDVDTTKGAWTLDWSSIVYTGHADFIKPDAVNEVMVAHYADLSPTDLESQFLDLELIHDGMWVESVNGHSADLGGLADADGNPFPGFDSTGTWILALRDSTSRNPAPLFLTVLNAE